MDKKELKRLLEEKKLADTLMKDESFRKEAEEILKSEGVEFDSKDLESTLKGIEKVLSGEVKVENDEDLDEVVGGISAKSVARTAIMAFFKQGSAYLGRALVAKSFGQVDKNSFRGGVSDVASGFSGSVTGQCGEELGIYICEKLGLND